MSQEKPKMSNLMFDHQPLHVYAVQLPTIAESGDTIPDNPFFTKPVTEHGIWRSGINDNQTFTFYSMTPESLQWLIETWFSWNEEWNVKNMIASLTVLE